MISQEYIKSALQVFISKFSQTRVRYEFDSTALTHYIEVVPNSVYHLDEEYISWESAFYDLFVSQFPNQNICFISDDSLVGLDEIQFELVGSKFVEYSVNNDFNCIPTDSVNYNEQKSTSYISNYSVFNGLGSISVNPISAFTFNLNRHQALVDIYNTNGCFENKSPSYNEEYYPLAA
ncbi:MAG: hypothetical protein WCX31_02400 [Salinivirgaceae bacterium]|jgi:hypothetical protein